jgi:hypothetical protein
MNTSRLTRLTGYCLLSFCIYILFAYYTNRSNFTWLIACFVLLFTLYFLIIRDTFKYPTGLKLGVSAAILFRLALLFSFPNLSDDIYRFIWDGNLLINGINPFAHMPEALAEGNALLPFSYETLYSGLNSPEYYSVYPPVCQFIFGISAWLFGEQVMTNIIGMRLFILTAEVATFWVLKKLLDYYELNPTYLLFYALNPLVILELTGNLHFEGLMISFLLFFFYLLIKKKYLWAAVFFTLAVHTKLIPLLLVPYLVFSLSWKRAAAFVAILTTGTFLLYLPFLDPSFINHFTSSLQLYFQSFEFNAGIYYLVRWIGFQFTGYNIIYIAGPLLAAFSTILILAVSWKYRDSGFKHLPLLFISVATLYYLFSTTVHPWYICSLLAFLPLTGLLSPLVWSFVIPLSYAAYATIPYTENLWLVALEYALVAAAIFFDYYRRNQPITQKMQLLHDA